MKSIDFYDNELGQKRGVSMQGGLVFLLVSLLVSLIQTWALADAVFDQNTNEAPSIVSMHFKPLKAASKAITDEPIKPIPDPRTDPQPKDPDYSKYDDTKLILDPTLTLNPRAGFAYYGDHQGMRKGAGVGVMIFLDSGRAGLLFDVQAAGGEGKWFGYLNGDIRARYRMPIDARHIAWWGFGANIGFQGATEPSNVDSYLAVQPLAFIGTMFTIKDTCVVHVFAKASLGIYDNRSQSLNHWTPNLDNMVKPSVGADLLAQCGVVRFITDYEHIFDFGPAGDAEHFNSQLSAAWPIKNSGLALGFFGKFVTRYLRANDEAVLGLDSQAENRLIKSLFTGLELRF